MFRRPIACCLLAGLLGVSGAASADACRQALILGLDVSLSVDPNEFALQREGLAQALRDAEVVAAFLTDPDAPVRLAVFEWSGQYDQMMQVDWVEIAAVDDLLEVSRRLKEAPPINRTGRTAIGAAMHFAEDALAAQAGCKQRTFDISGDGQNNNGPGPEGKRDRLEGAGIQVNALVIEAQKGSLTPYFERHVVTEPHGFTQAVAGFADYGEAMKRKLLRELQPAISSVSSVRTAASAPGNRASPAALPPD